MDPVSTVGLVASIVQLTKTTAQVISYASDVKDSSAERAQFSQHACSLLALLADLRHRIEEAKSALDPWFLSLRNLGTFGGPLDQLQGQMERLAAKLEPSPGRLKKVGKALVWALDKKEIEQVLVQIGRVKKLVMLSSQNDHL